MQEEKVTPLCGKLLLPSYYEQDDVLFLGKDLLGKCLFTCIAGIVTCGIINETESYKGPEDKASHAYNFRRTKRNEIMYASGGKSYVYFCYGMHYLFNIVTNIEGIPHAVLIRSIFPIRGIEHMKKRRNCQKGYPQLTYGPGRTAQALGIDISFYGKSLTSNSIWIEDIGISIPETTIEKLPRVGIDYAEEHASLPWRFRVHNSFLATITQTLQCSK